MFKKNTKHFKKKLFQFLFQKIQKKISKKKNYFNFQI